MQDNYYYLWVKENPISERTAVKKALRYITGIYFQLPFFPGHCSGTVVVAIFRLLNDP
ncbi:hypothetical protein BDV12DRAFT_163917 [Aspergillus spectabilis]